MNKGLVHIYHGGGKGKTTCGVGLCVRAAGAGMKVLIFQFMKTGESSELNILKKIPQIVIEKGTQNEKFIFQMNEKEKEEERNFYKQKFEFICKKVMEEEIDLLFLDEVLHAVNYDMLPENVLLNFLENKPEKLEVVLTGYHPSKRLMEAADYISFIDKIKHPFDCGVPERLGIEK